MEKRLKEESPEEDGFYLEMPSHHNPDREQLKSDYEMCKQLWKGSHSPEVVLEILEEYSLEAMTFYPELLTLYAQMLMAKEDYLKVAELTTKQDFQDSSRKELLKLWASDSIVKACLELQKLQQAEMAFQEAKFAFDKLYQNVEESSEKERLLGLLAMTESFLVSYRENFAPIELDLDSKLEAEVQKSMDNLCNWIIEGGGLLNKIRVCSFTENYRGIQLTDNASIAEELLFIPRKYIITYQEGFNYQPIKDFLESDSSKDSKGKSRLQSINHTPLAVFLMSEKAKGANSFYKPYFDTFPPDVEGLPTDFTEEELDLLRGSPILPSILTRKENIRKDWELLCEKIPDFVETYNFESFVYFRKLISSRVFGIEIDGLHTGGMVPFADMINHRTPKISAWVFDCERQGFKMNAFGSIRKGAELFDSYGKKCNSRFFMSYGFLEENNEADQFPFMIPIQPSFISYWTKFKEALQGFDYAFTKIEEEIAANGIDSYGEFGKYKITFTRDTLPTDNGERFLLYPSEQNPSQIDLQTSSFLEKNVHTGEASKNELDSPLSQSSNPNNLFGVVRFLLVEKESEFKLAIILLKEGLCDVSEPRLQADRLFKGGLTKSPLLDRLPILSWANELSCLGFIKELAQEQLKRYPELPKDQNVGTCLSGGSNYNKTLCRTYVENEKKLLRSLVSTMKLFISILKNTI